MFKRKRKGYIVIERGIGLAPFPPFYMPIKRQEYAKTKKEAIRIKREFKKKPFALKPISFGIERSAGYGRNMDLFIHSLKFENMFTNKRWKK